MTYVYPMSSHEINISHMKDEMDGKYRMNNISHHLSYSMFD